jgi:hypothetical protein
MVLVLYKGLGISKICTFKELTASWTKSEIFTVLIVLISDFLGDNFISFLYAF